MIHHSLDLTDDLRVFLHIPPQWGPVWRPLQDTCVSELLGAVQMEAERRLSSRQVPQPNGPLAIQRARPRHRSHLSPLVPGFQLLGHQLAGEPQGGVMGVLPEGGGPRQPRQGGRGPEQPHRRGDLLVPTLTPNRRAREGRGRQGGTEIRLPRVNLRRASKPLLHWARSVEAGRRLVLGDPVEARPRERQGPGVVGAAVFAMFGDVVAVRGRARPGRLYGGLAARRAGV